MNKDLDMRIREQIFSQKEIYDLALPIANRLAGEYDASPEHQTRLSQLDEIMRGAFVKNQELAELMKTVNDNRLLSTGTKQASAQLAAQISKMIKLFDEIEQKARVVKQNLLPELSQSLQARMMKSAYGGS